MDRFKKNHIPFNLKEKVKILFIGLLCLYKLQAQEDCNLYLEGRVWLQTDSQKILLHEAEIFIEELHAKIITTDSGFYHFDHLCKKTYELEVDFLQLHHHEIIKLDSNTFLDIIIDTKNYPNFTYLIDIIARKQRKHENLLLRTDQLLNTSGSSLASQLKSLPAIEVLQYGATIQKPILQNMQGLRLPIAIGGATLEGQQWGNDHAPELQSIAYSQIEVLRGVEAIKLSHAGAAGLIGLSNKSKPHAGEYSIQAVSSYQSNNQLLHFATNLAMRPIHKRWFGSAFISMRKAGNVRTPNYYLNNTGMEEIMAGARWGAGFKNKHEHQFFVSFFHTNLGIQKASHIGNVQDLRDALLRERPLDIGEFKYTIGNPRQTGTQTVFQYQFQYFFPYSKVSSEVTFQNNIRKEIDYNLRRNINMAQLHLVLSNIQSLSTWHKKVKRKGFGEIELESGMQHKYFFNEYKSFYFIPNYTAWNTGIFQLLKWHNKNVNQEFAVRADQHYYSANWTLRFVQQKRSLDFKNYNLLYLLRWEKRKHFLQFMYQRAWRNPWFNELYADGVHHASAAYEKGNENLQIEKSHNFNWDYQFKSKRISTGTHLYFQLLNNYIMLIPDTVPVLTVRGAFLAFQYKQFDAIQLGGQFYFHWQLSDKIKIYEKINYLYARNRSNKTFLPWIPPIRNSLELQMNLFLNHQLSLNWDWTAEQKYYTTGTDYLSPPSAFHLVNLEYSVVKIGKKKQLEVSLTVNNILNTQYRSYLDRFRYFSDMPGRNVGVRAIYKLHHHNEKNKKTKNNQ